MTLPNLGDARGESGFTCMNGWNGVYKNVWKLWTERTIQKESFSVKHYKIHIDTANTIYTDYCRFVPQCKTNDGCPRI